MDKTPLAANSSRLACAALLIAGFAFAVPIAHAGGPAAQPVRSVSSAAAAKPEAVDRYIVKFRDAAADPRTRLGAVGGRMGRELVYLRAMSGGAHVVRFAKATQGMAGDSAIQAGRAFARQIAQDPDVAYAELDTKIYPLLIPNDPLYNSSQWDLFEPVGGIDMPAAWDITTGSSSIFIGVIDTGYRPHADLASRIVQGYDFITDVPTANDGDGRDADASDPGDTCNGSASSWHGTHVSGTIGAVSNNGVGITGINWVSKIQPARVLGVCGGYTSDIADAMRWSAGIAVTGAPVNATPVRVQNLSLGGSGSCSTTFQNAINDVVAKGTVVVVAAGNDNADASNTTPASCANVIAVAATDRNGARASFSNYGSKVAIAAPGVGIVSTLNDGRTTPGNDSYATYSGTSMATPHVAGVVSLMLSQNPTMTPAQVKARLLATARAFPTGTSSDCTTALCGAGIVDAAAALAPAATSRTNLASQASGSVASASSVYSSAYAVSGVNDGDRRGTSWGSGGGWNDATANAFPDWVRIDFPSAQSISEIDVFTIQDNYQNPVEPTQALTFNQYGMTAYDVQYWNGSAWATVPNGSVSGNNKVWRTFTFPSLTTTSIRIQVNAALATYSRVVEIEAYKDLQPLNVASAANGATATASSTYNSSYPTTAAIDGDRLGSNWGAGGGWNDATANSFPDALQINFSATKSISEIDVFTIQDNYQNPQAPTETMTFSLYGITDFDVQYWNGSTWVTVPNGSVSGNNLVWRKFTFAAISTSAIRVNVRNALATYSRIVEVEAY